MEITSSSCSEEEPRKAAHARNGNNRKVAARLRDWKKRIACEEARLVMFTPNDGCRSCASGEGRRRVSARTHGGGVTVDESSKRTRQNEEVEDNRLMCEGIWRRLTVGDKRGWIR